MRHSTSLLLLLLAGLAACTPRDVSDPERVETQLRALDLRGRLAQLVVVGPGVEPLLDGGRVALAGAVFDPRTRLAGPREVGEPERVAPLLVATLEGDERTGRGGLAEEVALLPPREARALGRRVGAEARAHGVQLGVVRLSMERMNRLAVGDAGLTDRIESFLAGLGESGILVGVEVFAPEASTDTTLWWDAARLTAVEGVLVEAGVRTGAAALLPAGVRLPGLTGDTLPLPLSASVSAILHRDHAWEGVILADLSPGSPLLRGRSVEEAAVRAIVAGADLLLSPPDPARVLDALVAAVGEGRLDRGRVDEAARRVLRMKLRAERAPPHRGPPPATAPPAPGPGAPPVAGPEMLRELPPDEAGMSPAALARADSLMQRALAQGLYTAGVLTVGRGGAIVHQRGFGEQSDGAPVDPAGTVFDLASLTKVIATTTAAALVVEDGALQLDDRVRSHLPDFTGEGKEEVTVRQLLTHTSGLPAGLWLYGSARSPEAALEQVLRQRLRRAPGEEVEYSDLGMILLAGVVESAAGEPLDQLLARRVFAPLGMSSTMFLPPAALRERVVPTAIRNERGFVLHGVVHDANAFRLGGVAGHSGLFGTARDVHLFGQMMLQGGTLGDVRILRPETVATFVRRQPGAGTRALGWDTPADRSSAGRLLSARTFGHTGYTGTSLWIDPELDLVVVLLTNRTYESGTPAGILALRAAVHEAVAAGITDRTVTRRPGAR